MAKPTVDIEWASSDITDPLSTQDNKVEPNYIKKSDGWSYLEKPPFNWMNYWQNGVYQYIEHLYTIKGRSDTVIIASSDSEDESQDSADYVIDTGVSAHTQINTILTNLAIAGGGSVILMEGTYNIEDPIVMRSNIHFKGVGVRTKLVANYTSSASLINCPFVTNSCISDILIDGNKASYQIPTAISGGSSYTNRFYNITVIDIYGSVAEGAFAVCYNMHNCYVSGCGNYGFSGCNNLTNCFSIDNGDGFVTSTNLTSCYASGSTGSISGDGIGFGACSNVTSCKAEDCADAGFYNTDFISGCTADSCNIGFLECESISSCNALSNIVTGFESCLRITSCIAKSNTTYGFDGCNTMGFNKASSNGTDYSASYADSGTSNAAADSAAGGYNY